MVTLETRRRLLGPKGAVEARLALSTRRVVRTQARTDGEVVIVLGVRPPCPSHAEITCDVHGQLIITETLICLLIFFLFNFIDYQPEKCLFDNH